MFSRDDPSSGGSLPSEECMHAHQKRRRCHHHHKVLSSAPSTSALFITLCCAYIFSPLNRHLCTLPCSKSALYGSCIPTNFVVQAFSTPKLLTSHISTRSNAGHLRIDHQLQVASSSTPTSTNAVSTRQELEKMTVKQLKSYIQDNDIEIPKGQSSSLKLKKQIVDFIWNYQLEAQVDGGGISPITDDDNLNDNHIGQVNGEVNGKEAVAAGLEEVNGDEVNDKLAESSPASKARVTKKSFGTGMPPLPTTTAAIDNNIKAAATPYVPSPKDRIVLDVLNQYPPLHESILNACTDADITQDNLPIEGITTANIEQCDLTVLNYVVPTDVGEGDIRHTYHPMMANVSQSDMDVVFIGTASCTPGVTRGVSCTALRLNWRSNRSYDQDGKKKQQQEQQQSRGQKKKSGTYVEERGPTGGTWLFDCGESTQLSIQKTSSVKPGKISKIFITHCHGDHSFGLPGLLCLMGTDRDRDAPPIEIYGPEGLRMWLRVAIRYSVSRVVPSYRVHELMDVPMAPEWEEGHRRNGRFYFQLKWDDREMSSKDDSGDGGRRKRRWGMQGLAGADPSSWISRAPMINLEPSRDFGEIDGGRDIYPEYDHPQSTDGAPIWTVGSEDDVTVTAAPMSHGVPCVGYVVREHDRPGRLKPEAVLPVIERNRQGLKEAGVRNPMKIMAMVKNLPEGGQYEFPDGTVLRQEDVVEPMRRGRKVVVCGDTADCRALEGLAQDADVVVHEATNTFLPGVDKDGNMRLVTRDAKIHGHSTPYMAGEFAKRINAKKLVLNHFSARYKGDQSIESITIMTRMERQAMKSSGLSDDSVAAAWDFMVLPVARND